MLKGDERDEARLIEPEIKLSHQEAVIDSLQQTVYEQQKVLDELSRQVKRLGKLADGSDSGPDIGPANEKPPHY